MILVGRITRTQETTDGRRQAEFRCTNKEVFNFFVPPAIQPPEDELIRCTTHRPEGKNGRVSLDNVLNHWEKL